METKKWFESKTFWLAVIQGIVAVATIFYTNFPSMGWLLIVKSIADIYLRATVETKLN